MGQIKVTLPPGVDVDPTRLTSAVRFAVQGTDPGKLWTQNTVPAIAQLEEAAYDAGMQDLAQFYEEVVTGLELPPDPLAGTVLNKALQRGGPETPDPDQTPLPDDFQPLLPSETEILDDLRKAFGFQEDQHPRQAAGAAQKGYRPGEFVPKGQDQGGAGGTAVQDYLEQTPQTGVGFDNRQQPAQADPASFGRRWGAGTPLSDRECEEMELPRGMLDYTPEEQQRARQADGMGSGFHLVGPKEDPYLRAEAQRMKGRIEDRFPEWIRRRMQDQGVQVMLTAAPPFRVFHGTQDQFFHWVRAHPSLANNMSPDLSPGVYIHPKKAVMCQIGFSSPGPGNPMGAVNLEGHEYAHAVDYNLLPSGHRVSDTPEWKAIVDEVSPHLDAYSARSDELFAEGLNCYLESPELRQQMENGPWRRMAEFFSQLLQEDQAPAPMQKAAAASKAPKAQPLTIPTGYGWRSFNWTEAEGGPTHMDGWGPKSPSPQ